MTINTQIKTLLSWVQSIVALPNNMPYQIIVDTPWSLVLQISFNQKIYYLKQTPAALFIEAEIIKIMTKFSTVNALPNIIGVNAKLNCFLMEECGSQSLRTLFDGKLDKKVWLEGIEAYIKIQRNSEQNLNHCLKIGIPDWRLEVFPDLYQNVLLDEKLLQDEGLEQDEIMKLQIAIPAIKKICQNLQRFNIKNTIVNADFNENNLIYDAEKKQCTVIDWGESVISHPFFTIATHLTSIARRYHFKTEEDEIIQTVRNQWLSYWSDIHPMNELVEIYAMIKQITPIFSSLALYRLQTATNNASKLKQNWFIKDWLGAVN